MKQTQEIITEMMLDVIGDDAESEPIVTAELATAAADRETEAASVPTQESDPVLTGKAVIEE